MNMNESQKKTINTQLLERVFGKTPAELPRKDIARAQIIRRQYLSHIKEPMLTIRPDGIQFNNTCLLLMEDVVYIQPMIIEETKEFVVRASRRGDVDAQRWCTVKEEKRVSRKITGRDACTKIYEMMGWSKAYYYKICGSPALKEDDEDELLLVFNLTETESYSLTEKARINAGVLDEDIDPAILMEIRELESLEEKEKLEAELRGEKYVRKRKKAVTPQGWQEHTFGLTVAEHKNRVEIPRLSEDVDQLSLF